MKFKTKEELIKESMGKEFDNGHHPYRIGIDKAFKSFAERVEFYKKYRVHVTKPDTAGQYFLEKEHPEIYKLYKKHLKDNHKKLGGWVVDIYNNWLFDYCFGDVIE